MLSKKCGFLIVVIFSANLIFGLPVDSSEETTTEIPNDNSTNGTHKEFSLLNHGNMSDGMTLAELVDEKDEVANVTETEYDYYDDNMNMTTNFTSDTFDNSTYETNITKHEEYIIKATTYEIGVLADVPNDDNTTDNGPVTRQQVDLSFYDTKSNDSFINFGDVPLPVQTTSVNGQVITGIAPVHIGAVDDVEDVLKALPFTGTILNITQKDTSYVHLNRENLTEADQVVLNDKEDLAKLPILNNILLPDNFDEAFESVKNQTES